MGLCVINPQQDAHEQTLAQRTITVVWQWNVTSLSIGTVKSGIRSASVASRKCTLVHSGSGLDMWSKMIGQTGVSAVGHW